MNEGYGSDYRQHMKHIMGKSAGEWKATNRRRKTDKTMYAWAIVAGIIALEVAYHGSLFLLHRM